VLFVDEGASVAYLELTPYQAQTVWAMQAAGLQLWGERYGSLSDPLPSLIRLDIGQITIPALTAPASVPAEDADTAGADTAPASAPAAAPDLPGADGTIPGSRP